MFILGNGSNILLSDKGIRGLVIRNICAELRQLSSTSIEACNSKSRLRPVGAMLPRVGHEAIKARLVRLVYATGIPGSGRRRRHEQRRRVWLVHGRQPDLGALPSPLGRRGDATD